MPEPAAAPETPPAEPPKSEESTPSRPSGVTTGQNGTNGAAAAAERLATGAGRGVSNGSRAAWQALVERRGLRIALAGIVLIIVALEVGTGSALGLVLGIAGLVMLVIGAMGPRLRGRISMEFGPGGTSFEIQTHVAPPGHRLPAPPPSEDIGRPRMSLVPTSENGSAPAASPLADDDVVESTGQTIEIDVAQLKAMLAAERNAS